MHEPFIFLNKKQKKNKQKQNKTKKERKKVTMKSEGLRNILSYMCWVPW